jgi:hypothetical protein
MKISLLGSGKLWLFVVVLLLLAGGFSFEAAKGWLAAHWAASPRSEDWFRAANLEPGNAEYSEWSSRAPASSNGILERRVCIPFPSQLYIEVQPDSILALQ